MGPRLPEALAGSDNQVEASEEGMRKVLELIAGTSLAAAIVAAGVFLFNKANEAVNSGKQMQDFY